MQPTRHRRQGDWTRSPKLPKRMIDMYFAAPRRRSRRRTRPSTRACGTLCRDVIELRRANWVPRVKKLEAMTLSTRSTPRPRRRSASRPRRRRILFPERPGRRAGRWWARAAQDGQAGPPTASPGLWAAGSKVFALRAVRRRRAPGAAMPTEKEKRRARRDTEGGDRAARGARSGPRSAARRRTAVPDGAAATIPRRGSDAAEGGGEDHESRVNGVHAGCRSQGG